jgi:hypothetical protein
MGKIMIHPTVDKKWHLFTKTKTGEWKFEQPDGKLIAITEGLDLSSRMSIACTAIYHLTKDIEHSRGEELRSVLTEILSWEKWIYNNEEWLKFVKKHKLDNGKG